ncbi:MAG: hypothetical protein IPM02_24185 [Betaproteobacteria bacterium]|nr:hypothetical protein [Betaproteobacteria bacterium]
MKRIGACGSCVALALWLALGVAWMPQPAFAQNPLAGISNVFVIVMENHNWSLFRGSPSAPYINHTLLPMASYANAYYTPPGLSHSLPNYLWMEAGTGFGVADNADPFVHAQDTTAHLVTQLAAAEVTWKSYQESISGALCPLRENWPYAPKHNPFVYFKDVTDDNNEYSAHCIAHVRPLSELAADLRNGTVPRYAFITPNLCSGGHDSCAPLNDQVAQTDAWLRDNLPMIMSSEAYRRGGAIFITWDEGSSGDGPIGMIVISPFAKGYGFSNSIRYDHGSLLRTLQEIFSVSPLLGDAAKQSSLADLFQGFATPPPACTVDATPASLPLGGTVTLTARCSPPATSSSWTPALGLAAGVAGTATVKPAAAGSYQYSVTGSNAAGAGNRADVTVFVTAETAVEFYNPDLDHYFITADPVEQAFVEGGAVGRWLRTGASFKVGGPNAVCRFYGNTAINPATGVMYGPNSHFYTAETAECAFLKSIFNPAAKSWKFESNDFATTIATGGACPGSLTPIYRAYNNAFPRADSNHRITSSTAGIQEVVTRGWRAEGVVMCAPR